MEKKKGVIERVLESAEKGHSESGKKGHFESTEKGHFS